MSEEELCGDCGGEGPESQCGICQGAVCGDCVQINVIPSHKMICRGCYAEQFPRPVYVESRKK